MGIVVFPDAVAVTLEHLRDTLPGYGYSEDDVTVHREIPKARPSMFVRVLRTGGPQTHMVLDGAQLTFEAWADTSEDAHDLAQVVRGIVNDRSNRIWDGVPVGRVEELAGPGDLPDPDSDQQRYTWSAIVKMRGVELDAVESA